MKTGDVLEFVIERMGRFGDGVATLGEDLVFVPYTVAGDRVRVKIEANTGYGYMASLRQVLWAGNDRAGARCRHFESCGGCSLQHLENTFYENWKWDLVVSALEYRGVEGAEVEPLVRVPAESRRRAEVKVERPGDGGPVRLGFLERDSHRLVNLEECPVLLGRLAGLFEPLRALCGEVLDLGESAAIHLTQSEAGPDLLFKLARPFTTDELGRLGAFAEQHDIARMSWTDGKLPPEPVVQRRRPFVMMGHASVTPPPGAFLQPTAAGQKVLADKAVAAVAGAKAVADLFCGCGTFSLAVAAHAPVHAVDKDPALISALDEAARHTSGLKPVKTAIRDLFRRPLGPAELKDFQAVIIDPPRAGAAAQVKALAGSAVPVLVVVSCNPATFARDARILTDSGYRLRTVCPVDQFPWSPHLELVAVFER